MFKGLKEAVKEIIESVSNIDNRRWILLVTTSLDEDNRTKKERVTEEQAVLLLRSIKANLLVFGYRLNKSSESTFQKMCMEVSKESRLLVDPKEDEIQETFLSIANYKFENEPLILEMFT